MLEISRKPRADRTRAWAVEWWGKHHLSAMPSFAPVSSSKESREECQHRSRLWDQPHAAHLSSNCGFPTAGWGFLCEIEPQLVYHEKDSKSIILEQRETWVAIIESQCEEENEIETPRRLPQIWIHISIGGEPDALPPVFLLLQHCVRGFYSTTQWGRESYRFPSCSLPRQDTQLMSTWGLRKHFPGTLFYFLILLLLF